MAVDRSTLEIGRVATEIIVEQIENTTTVTRKQYIMTKLIIRELCLNANRQNS